MSAGWSAESLLTTSGAHAIIVLLKSQHAYSFLPPGCCELEVGTKIKPFPPRFQANVRVRVVEEGVQAVSQLVI